MLHCILIMHISQSQCVAMLLILQAVSILFFLFVCMLWFIGFLKWMFVMVVMVVCCTAQQFCIHGFHLEWIFTGCVCALWCACVLFLSLVLRFLVIYFCPLFLHSQFAAHLFLFATYLFIFKIAQNNFICSLLPFCCFSLCWLGHGDDVFDLFSFWRIFLSSLFFVLSWWQWVSIWLLLHFFPFLPFVYFFAAYGFAVSVTWLFTQITCFDLFFFYLFLCALLSTQQIYWCECNANKWVDNDCWMMPNRDEWWTIINDWLYILLPH